ncbi:MAG TPA: nucleotide exchange factor GrpE [Firmicutes bacterium]|nr:nucleotide exchange factor GrpE [Candidatus Fermentithermobacillaceae bacterium]
MEKKPVDDRENRPQESACPEDVTTQDAGEVPGASEEREAPQEGLDTASQVEELSAKVAGLSTRVAELEERLAGAASEIERIASERDTWQSKATALFDQYNRVRADFDGFRKRTVRDFEDRLIREKGEFIRELLEVMDNFERFLKASEKGLASGDKNFEAFHKGVVMIERQLMDVLLREGVTPIESPVGKPMDPEYHDAVAAQDGGGEHGTVVEELQTGYMYKGTVLRPTRVKVIR